MRLRSNAVEIGEMCSDISLKQLLPELGEEADFPVHGLCMDSRRLCRGEVFFACVGEENDGRRYIGDALARGAVAVVMEQTPGATPPVSDAGPVFAVSGLRDRLGRIADHFYQSPSLRLQVIGVTGTDGKSSSCNFLAQALYILGESCGMIANLGCYLNGSRVEETGLTTPGVLDLHRLLSVLCERGAVRAVLELSSQGLQQGRAQGLHVRAALLTGISADHLEYHGSLQAYVAAKAQLFQRRELDLAVLNQDDPYAVEIAARLNTKTELLSWGFGTDARMRAEILADGTTMHISGEWGEADLHCTLPGRFNLQNLLGCAAMLVGNGFSLPQVVAALQRVHLPLGRMQFLPNRLNLTVVVDYAHTARALEYALQAVRDHCTGELWCVFGCGGRRDHSKRPHMGKIAEQLADRLILTEDNPRGEEVLSICEEICSGMEDPAACIILPNRRAALQHAIESLQSGDGLLIAGKGDERFQEYGGQREHFCDADCARHFLRERECGE